MHEKSIPFAMEIGVLARKRSGIAEIVNFLVFRNHFSYFGESVGNPFGRQYIKRKLQNYPNRQNAASEEGIAPRREDGWDESFAIPS